MIALLAGLAFARPGIDVLLLPLTAHTDSIVTRYEVLDVFGQPVVDRLDADRAGLDHRGIAVEIANTPAVLAPHQWLLMMGVRASNPRFDRPAFTFAPTAGELSVGAGLRAWFTPDEEPLLDGYGVGFTGFQLAFVSATPFTRLALAPAATTGLGLGVAGRRGRIRPRIEGRAELAARWDHLEGRLEEPNGAMVFRWFPGSAAVSILVGLGFGPADRPDVE